MKPLLFICMFFLLSLQYIFAQNFLDHTTGSITGSVMDDGSFGVNDGSLSNPHVGNGFVFMNNINPSYTGGFIMGNADTKCSGHLASFNIQWDMVTSVPFSQFDSLQNFNQVSMCTFSDNNAPLPNRIGLTVTQLSYSQTGDDFVILVYKVKNNTASARNGVYLGQFQDWDIGEAAFDHNRGGYDQQSCLAYQYLNGGNPDPNYYGIAVLTGWSGARVCSYWDPGTARDSAYKWISTLPTEQINIDNDYRMFVGCGPFDIGVGQEVQVAFAYCAGTNLDDIKNNAILAKNKYMNFILPVELTSFTGSSYEGKIVLNWSTETETNNRTFEIERRQDNSQFIVIGVVDGHGTTTREQEYSFTDNNVSARRYIYRLKQIDYDGRYQYSKEIEINGSPAAFVLEQNYPNPFNPSTIIRYNTPHEGIVTLKVYDVLGREAAVLINGEKPAGSYEIEFNAAGLSSGIYFYTLTSGAFSETRKMILTK